MDANRVRELRKARGMSPTELAYRVGRSVQAIWTYETGERVPPLPVAREIARALGASLDDVFPDNAPTDDPVAA